MIVNGRDNKVFFIALEFIISLTGFISIPTRFLIILFINTEMEQGSCFSLQPSDFCFVSIFLNS